MNFVVSCVLIACLLPYLCTGLAKIGGSRGERFDNASPRPWLAGLDGFPARANWAQQNSWEALPVFLAGVLLARQSGVATELLNFWCALWVLARLAYIGCYLANWASLRSLVWLVGTCASFRLIVAAL